MVRTRETRVPCVGRKGLGERLIVVVRRPLGKACIENHSSKRFVGNCRIGMLLDPSENIAQREAAAVRKTSGQANLTNFFARKVIGQPKRVINEIWDLLPHVFHLQVKSIEKYGQLSVESVMFSLHGGSYVSAHVSLTAREIAATSSLSASHSGASSTASALPSGLALNAALISLPNECRAVTIALFAASHLARPPGTCKSSILLYVADNAMACVSYPRAWPIVACASSSAIFHS